MKNTLIRVFCLCLIGAAVSALSPWGCGRPSGWFEPETVAEYSAVWGFKFRNTKNFKGHLKATVDPETGKIVGLDIEVDDNASEVNASQVALMNEHRLQMIEVRQEVLAHGYNIDRMQARLNELGVILTNSANVDIGKDGVKLGNQLAPNTPTIRQPDPLPPGVAKDEPESELPAGE